MPPITARQFQPGFLQRQDEVGKDIAYAAPSTFPVTPVLDDFRRADGPLQILTGAESNIVTNPSFETDLTGWVDTYAFLTTFARQNGWASSGSWSLRMTRVATGNDYPTAGYLPGGSLFNVVPGELYELSADFNVQTASYAYGSINMRLQFSDANGSYICNGWDIRNGNTGTGTQTIRGVVQVPLLGRFDTPLIGPTGLPISKASLQIWCALTSGNTFDTYIDNVSIKKVSAPNWQHGGTENDVGLAISSQKAQGTMAAGTKSENIWIDRNLVPLGNCEAYAEVAAVPATGQSISVNAHVARPWDSSAGTQGYRVDVFKQAGTDQIAIQCIGQSTLATYAQEVSVGDGIGIRMIGTNIEAWYRAGTGGTWTKLGSAGRYKDFDRPAYIGIRSTDSAGAWTKFGGGAVPLIPQAKQVQFPIQLDEGRSTEPITFVGQTKTENVGGSTTSTPVKPSAAAIGDVHVLMFLIDSSAVTVSMNGWNILRSDPDPGKNQTVLAWRREDGTAWGADVTWGGSSIYNDLIVLTYRNVYASGSPIAAHNGQVNAASANVDAPSITPYYANCMNIWIGMDDFGQTITLPAGYTSRKMNNYDCQPGEKLLTTGDPTGTLTGTHTSNRSTGQQVALLPRILKAGSTVPVTRPSAIRAASF